MATHFDLRRLWTAALLALALPLVMLAARADYAVDTPEAAVATLHSGLVDLGAKRPTATVEERFQALEPLIVATHDLPYIAEFALRKQWPTLSETDRARFVAAFTKLSVMTYASRFVKVGPGTFKSAGPPQAQGERTQIATAIARSGQPDLPLEYLLQKEAMGWKIVNIIADGVSDLALKRAEYQRILTAGSLDDLIKELDAQTARLARG